MQPLPDIQRRHFISALKAIVEPQDAEPTSVGLMLIDIAGLGKINANHGYDAGDYVLAQAYDRLLQISKLADTVFRIGGHSFAFILPGLNNPAFVTLAVNKVVSVLQSEVLMGDYTLAIEPRVGLAISHGDQTHAMQLFADAERSLERVKLGNTIEFDELLGNTGSKPQEKGELEARLSSALQAGELELYFQPKIDLLTGQVNSAEALLRWTDEAGAPILAPPAIIALAAKCGEEFELTQWIAAQCIRTLSQWRGVFDLGLAFNVQANLVNHRDLLSSLEDTRAIWGVEAGRITLEITEDAILEDQETGCGSLDLIRAAGMNLSIDDFGTGYSSMSYFQQIPATELKIDQSFVRTMQYDSQSMQLVKIMIDIGHQFGMHVVAEGIESAETLEALKALGCDYGQGYFFTQPLPRDKFEQWLRERDSSSGASKRA